MSSTRPDKRDELPATVPQRPRADATMVVTSPPVMSASADTIESDERSLVASEVSPEAILELVRLPPTDRLVLDGRVAAGGMGAIDVAIDKALDRRVAMKTLHANLREEDNSVRMFLREARLTGLLDHPHIVPVYDIAEGNEGQLYFTMKLVEGKTLEDIIYALPKGVLEVATLYTLLDVVARVCDALAFAHSKGVIHCDVKPANVMVGEFGQVFLMDWGIAKLVSTREETDSSIIGTAAYMSPEQARGDRKSLDARSDVFLIGALLYEILTRKPPYASKDRLETLLMAQSATFPRITATEIGVSTELERIVMRAMAKAPNDRYPSIASLKEDLVRFMRGGAEFPRRSFAKGDIIIAEGDTGDAAFIIVEGSCDVSKMIGGVNQTLHTIVAGDVFGEMAILTHGQRTATVTAAEPTTVLVVTQHVLEQELAALKPWMATLLKSLATRFRDIDTQQRASFAHAPSFARIANQVFMHVQTWGEDGSVAWSKLVPELEAQLGLPPIALFAVISKYGMDLDAAADKLTVRDLPALKERLRTELAT